MKLKNRVFLLSGSVPELLIEADSVVDVTEMVVEGDSLIDVGLDCVANVVVEIVVEGKKSVTAVGLDCVVVEVVVEGKESVMIVEVDDVVLIVVLVAVLVVVLVVVIVVD